MLSPLMCLCFLLRDGDDGSTYVLLGQKKRGLGAGNIVGLGGKVEPEEDARAAAAREVAEESGVVIDVGDLEEMAMISFWFPTRPGWDQRAAVFVARRWQGEPVETDEITPGWYDVNAIPFDAMWSDARHWLPHVLAGRRLTAGFTFQTDLTTLASSQVRASDSPTGVADRRTTWPPPTEGAKERPGWVSGDEPGQGVPYHFENGGGDAAAG